MSTLILKTSSFGDVVHAFPVVEYLKSRQQVEKIGWVVESRVAPLVRSHPLVDVVIEIDTKTVRSHFPSWTAVKEFCEQRKNVRKDDWDLLIDLQGNAKSGLVTWLARAKKKVGYGVRTAAERLNTWTTDARFDPPKGIPIREEYLWLARQAFQDPHSFEPTYVELNLTEDQEQAFQREKKRWPNGNPVWFVAVGSNWPNKMCNTSSLLYVLHMIRERFSPHFIFLAGTSGELNEVGSLAREFSSSSHVLFRQDLPLLQRLMGEADAVIGVDSLVLHLAATTKTPTFSFFGPSSALKYAPRGPQHAFFQTHCPSFITFDRRCPSLRTCPTGLCMKDADPEKMFQAILRWQQFVVS